MKRSKNYRKAIEKKEDKVYSLVDACSLVCDMSAVKFDETVDMVVRLGVDPRKADQNVRGSLSLPNGLGKTVRVAVICKGDDVQKAKDAGADLVGGDDLIDEIKNGNMDFDTLISSVEMMPNVARVGKILGPRGLMPSPKVGTVTDDIAGAVQRIKAGVAEYRVDKDGNVHAPVGKVSFGGEKLEANANALIAALNKVKPQSSKGVYLKSASISSTMGPGVDFDLAAFR